MGWRLGKDGELGAGKNLSSAHPVWALGAGHWNEFRQVGDGTKKEEMGRDRHTRKSL